MAPEFVRFFAFIKLVIYEFTCNGQINETRQMIKNERVATNYYHGNYTIT